MPTNARKNVLLGHCRHSLTEVADRAALRMLSKLRCALLTPEHVLGDLGLFRALCDYTASAAQRLCLVSNSSGVDNRFSPSNGGDGHSTASTEATLIASSEPSLVAQRDQGDRLCTAILELLGVIAATSRGCCALQRGGDDILAALDTIICQLGEHHEMACFASKLIAAVSSGTADQTLAAPPTASTQSSGNSGLEATYEDNDATPAAPVLEAVSLRLVSQPSRADVSPRGPMADAAAALWAYVGISAPQTTHQQALPAVHMTDRDEQVLFDAAALLVLAVTDGGDEGALQSALAAEGRSESSRPPSITGIPSRGGVFVRGHAAVLSLQRTVLADFPPEVLLSRPDCLMHTVALLRLACDAEVQPSAEDGRSVALAQRCTAACVGVLCTWLGQLQGSVCDTYGAGQYTYSSPTSASAAAAVGVAASDRAGLVRTHYAVGNTKPPGSNPPAHGEGGGAVQAAWHQRFMYPPAQSPVIHGSLPRPRLCPLWAIACIAGTAASTAASLGDSPAVGSTFYKLHQLQQCCIAVASVCLPVLLGMSPPASALPLMGAAAEVVGPVLRASLQTFAAGGTQDTVALGVAVHTAKLALQAAAVCDLSSQGPIQAILFGVTSLQAQLVGLARHNHACHDALHSIVPELCSKSASADQIAASVRAFSPGSGVAVAAQVALASAPNSLQLAALSAIACSGSHVFECVLRCMGGAAPWGIVAMLVSATAPPSQGCSPPDLQSNALSGLLLHLQNSIVAALDEDDELRGGVAPAGHPPSYADLNSSNVTADTATSHVSISAVHMPRLLQLLVAVGSSALLAAIAHAAACAASPQTRALAVRCIGLLLEAAAALPTDLKSGLPEWMLGEQGCGSDASCAHSPLLLWLPSMRGPLAQIKRGGAHADAASSVDAHLHSALESASADHYLSILTAEVFSVHAPVRDAAAGALREFVIRNAEGLLSAVPGLNRGLGHGSALQAVRAAALGGVAASNVGPVAGVVVSVGGCNLGGDAAAARGAVIDRVLHSVNGQMSAHQGRMAAPATTGALADSDQLLAVAQRRLGEVVAWSTGSVPELCRTASQLYEACIVLTGVLLASHSAVQTPPPAHAQPPPPAHAQAALTALAQCSAKVGWEALSAEGGQLSGALHMQLCSCWAQGLFLLEAATRCFSYMMGVPTASIPLPPSAVFAAGVGILSTHIAVSAAAACVLLLPFVAPAEACEGGLETLRQQLHALSCPGSSPPRPALCHSVGEQCIAQAAELLDLLDSMQVSTPAGLPCPAAAVTVLQQGMACSRSHAAFMRAASIAQCTAACWPEAAQLMAAQAWWSPLVARMLSTPPRSDLDSQALASALHLLSNLVPHMCAEDRSGVAQCVAGVALETALAEAHRSTYADSHRVLPAADASYWDAAEYCIDAHYAGGVGLLMRGDRGPSAAASAAAASAPSGGVAAAAVQLMGGLIGSARRSEHSVQAITVLFEKGVTASGLAGALILQALQSRAPMLQLSAAGLLASMPAAAVTTLPLQLTVQFAGQLVGILRQFRSGDSFQGKASALASMAALQNMLGCVPPYLPSASQYVPPALLTKMCDGQAMSAGVSPMGWLARCVTDRDARLRAGAWAMVGPLAHSSGQSLAHVAAVLCSRDDTPSEQPWQGAASRLFACLLRCTLRDEECVAVRCAAGASLAHLGSVQPLHSQAAVDLLEAKEGIASRAAAQLLQALDEACSGGLNGVTLPRVAAILPHCAAWSDLPCAQDILGDGGSSSARAQCVLVHDLTSRCTAALVHVRALSAFGPEYMAAHVDLGAAAQLQQAMALGTIAASGAAAGADRCMDLALLGAALVTEAWDALSALALYSGGSGSSAAAEAQFVLLSGAGIPCLLTIGGDLAAAADGRLLSAALQMARRLTSALRDTPHQPQECPVRSAKALAGMVSWLGGALAPSSGSLTPPQLDIVCAFVQQLCWCPSRVVVPATWGSLIPVAYLGVLLDSLLQQLLAASVPTGLADWQEELHACVAEVSPKQQARHLAQLAATWFGPAHDSPAMVACDHLLTLGRTAGAVMTLGLAEASSSRPAGGSSVQWWAAPLRLSAAGLAAIVACAGEAASAVAAVATIAPRGTQAERQVAEAAQVNMAAAAATCLHAALLPCCAALSQLPHEGGGAAADEGPLWLTHLLVEALAQAVPCLPGILSLAHVDKAGPGLDICAAVSCVGACAVLLLQQPSAREVVHETEGGPDAGRSCSLLAGILPCVADLLQVATATSRKHASVPKASEGALSHTVAGRHQLCDHALTTAERMVFLPGTPTQLAHLFLPALPQESGNWGAVAPLAVEWWQEAGDSTSPASVVPCVAAAARFAFGATLAALGLAMGGPSHVATAVIRSGVWAHIITSVTSTYAASPGSRARTAVLPLMQALGVGAATAASISQAGAKSILPHCKLLFTGLGDAPLPSAALRAAGKSSVLSKHGVSVSTLLHAQQKFLSNLSNLSHCHLELAATLSRHRLAAAALGTVFKEEQLGIVTAAVLQLVKSSVEGGGVPLAPALVVGRSLLHLHALLSCSAEIRRAARQSPHSHGSEQTASAQSSLLLLRHVLQQETRAAGGAGQVAGPLRLLLQAAEACTSALV